MNNQIKEAAETPVAKLRNALTPIYSFASSYLLLKENPFNDSEILIQQANRIDSNRHVIDDLLTQLESEYALSEKEEIKAYKKQISELQSKLMTERRSNAKIAKLAEKEEEWIPVMQKFIHSAYVGCTKDELWAIVKEAEDLINPK